MKLRINIQKKKEREKEINKIKQCSYYCRSWFILHTPCLKRPCQNGGVCTPGYDEDSHKCDCKTGLTGKNCEISKQHN